MENGNGRNHLSSLQISQPPSPPGTSSLLKILVVASIAAGVQFGWALQLSLLTPYVQLLGIPHTWSGYIWLCGPISGMIVQPFVGYYSDRCKSRFGRRRPFIAAGAALVGIAVILIGFAADIGHASGDPVGKVIKPRAISVFIIGFWILDVANNMLQGPCRAFLADLSGGNTSRMRTANAAFSFFMAVGNVLGYAAGAYKNMYKIFPFSKTTACDIYCANLKSCFFISIALLAILTIIALTLIKEPDQPETSSSTLEKNINDDTMDQNCCMKLPFFGEIIGALKDLPRPMWMLLLVTCLNWVAWFPFILFDTDWMGKEVYGGNPDEGNVYNLGVRAGSLGLMIMSIVLGFTSVAIPCLSKVIGGANRLWGGVNLLLAVCLAMTVLVTKKAESSRQYSTGPGGKLILQAPEPGIKAAALALFGVLGIPQAITFSIPFALASIFSSNTGAGQGLSLGVLNLSIVVPQMFVSVLSGPWDALFGGGNLPAFIVGAVSAVASGIFCIDPSTSSAIGCSDEVGCRRRSLMGM